jgi:hypothetical protein
MRPRLTQALGLAPDDLLLDTPVLLRHKEGRRAIVQYDVEIACCDGTRRRQTLLGKLRVKGPDYKRRASMMICALPGSMDAPLDGSGCQPTGAALMTYTYGSRTRSRDGPLPISCGPRPTRPCLRASVPRWPHCTRTVSVANREWSLDDEYGVLEAALNRSARIFHPIASAHSDISRGAAKASCPRARTVVRHSPGFLFRPGIGRLRCSLAGRSRPLRAWRSGDRHWKFPCAP